MVADTKGDSKVTSSVPSTPIHSESASTVDVVPSTYTSEQNETREDGIEAESVSGTTAQESEASTLAPPPGTDEQASSKSLVGRMNNLISTDLQALQKGPEALQIFVSVPLGIIGSLIFLYNILGWR